MTQHEADIIMSFVGSIPNNSGITKDQKTVLNNILTSLIKMTSTKILPEGWWTETIEEEDAGRKQS